MGANIFTNRSMDGREGWDLVVFGNREPWRIRMSFSQEGGPFVGSLFIGVISTARGCYIDREVVTLPSTFFLSDIRDRG